MEEDEADEGGAWRDDAGIVRVSVSGEASVTLAESVASDGVISVLAFLALVSAYTNTHVQPPTPVQARRDHHHPHTYTIDRRK